MNSLIIYHKIWASLIGILSISFIFLCCSKEKTYQPNKDFHKKPVQTLCNITLYKSEEGQVYARLHSPIVEYFSSDSLHTRLDSSRTVFPNGISILFYNKDMSAKAFLTAHYAINYTANSNIVYLRDSIKIINFNGHDTIYCKDLYWNQDQKVVYSHKPIRRYNIGGESFGEGLIANEQFDSVTVIHPHGKESFTDTD
ncbi:MAG: LPS export ABC transporter periplasmic protein LptC [Bacteroidales bacterium]